LRAFWAKEVADPLHPAHHASQTTGYGAIMETVRDTWTDDRLDDFRTEMSEFRHEVKDEFAAVRREMKNEFAAVRQEMKDEFTAVRREMRDEFRAVRREMKEQSDSLHAEIKALHKEMSLRFDSLQRIMIQFSGLMVAALIGFIATQA
jgi:predicted phage-related endonuclease